MWPPRRVGNPRVRNGITRFDADGPATCNGVPGNWLVAELRFGPAGGWYHRLWPFGPTNKLSPSFWELLRRGAESGRSQDER
jgi:hypothetical protein